MATITRQAAETVLIRRAGKFITAAGLDGDSRAGQNEVLSDPIATALLKMGLPVADLSDVKDLDIAAVVDADTTKFLDFAEYRLLQNIAGNLTLTDTTIGPRRERLGQLARELRRRIELLTKQLEKEYGLGSSELEAGQIDLAFQAHGDDVVIP